MNRRKCPSGPGESTPVYPWYKERLRPRCLKDPVQKLQFSRALNGRRWHFLTEGLDDFRDGYPATQARTFVPHQHGTEAARKPEKAPKRFTKDQVCFSKQNGLRQTRRQFLDAVEESLSTHPLAVYLHFGSGMAPQLYNEVLSTLAPDMQDKVKTPVVKEVCSKENMVSGDGLIQKTLTEKTVESPNSPKQDEVKPGLSQNEYKLKEAKQSFPIKHRTMCNTGLHAFSLDEEIKRVTKLFCNGFNSLGDEDNDITETRILSMFATSCEKNPAPILDDVEKPEEPSKDYSHNLEQKVSELNQVYTPSNKTIYGIWYLNPKTWKCPANEPLRDPSVTEDSVLEQHPTEKDEELKQIYGAQAFKRFIINKGQRVPRFLRSVFLEEEQNRTRVTDATASSLTPSGSAML